MDNIKRTVKLTENERLDDLQVKGYHIIQNPEKFCFGIDAVLLAAFAKIKATENALDLGTGTGIIPILLESKTEGKNFVGLEIQEESADMARRSVEFNHLEEKIEIVTGDIKEASKLFGYASFRVVTVNPPYMIQQHGIKNEADCKTIARHEVLCDLEDVIRESARVLHNKGRFYMVHRPFRVAEIMQCMMKHDLEPKRMRFVHPYVDKEPNMVLIEGVKGARSRILVEPPLIIYNADGSYTADALACYGEMKKEGR